MKVLDTNEERLQVQYKPPALEDAWEKVFKIKRDAVKRVQKRDPGERVLLLDWYDLCKHSDVLDEAFHQDAKRTYQLGEHLLDEQVGVEKPVLLGLHNVGEAFETRVDQIRSRDGHQLVTFRALVRQKGKVEKNFRYVAFECRGCGKRYAPIRQSIIEEEFTKPTSCKNCDTSGALMIDHARSVREDVTTCLLSPTYDQGTEGYSESLPTILRRDIAHNIHAGDEVRVTAYIDYQQQGNKKNKFHDVAVALHAERTTTRDSSGSAGDDDIDTWHRLSERTHFEELVIEAVSPSIHGFRDHREAMIISLFSSPRDGKRRGDINILAVGDPGTAKSHMLRCLEDASPRSTMVDAKNASNVGLTASVVKDELTGGYTVEAGALPMANQGVCLIDELDKADSQEIDALHEAMEQQTVTVNKAGINTQLPAQASVVAAANPKHGRWDLSQPPAEQLDFTPTILSRFDAILMFKDEVDESRDREIAEQILGDDSEEENPVTVDLVRKIAWWARENVDVDLTGEAEDLIQESYVEMRQDLSSEKHVGISPRQLESMKRFAEARARFYLRDTATKADAEWAVNLVEDWLSKIAVGRDGLMDIDHVMSGGKASQREKVNMVETALTELMEEGPDQDAFSVEDVADKCSGLGTVGVEKTLELMKEDGLVIQPDMENWRLLA